MDENKEEIVKTEPVPAQKEAAKKSSTNKALIVVIIILVLVVVAGAAVMLFRPKEDSGGLKYATNAQVVISEEDMQDALDAANANAENGNVGLKYKNDAYSENGKDFECYIVNSESNLFDMFLTIYTTVEMEDQIYLSGLIPPGSGIEKLTLQHRLDAGDHRVYVVVTQVKHEEDGTDTIANQVIHTMDFHVG